MQDLVKTAVLLRSAPNDLKEYLHMHSDKFGTCQAMKELLTQYAIQRKPWQGPQPMDIGAIEGKGKGKGKYEKGKGKYDKGKGKGKGKFDKGKGK